MARKSLFDRILFSEVSSITVAYPALETFDPLGEGLWDRRCFRVSRGEGDFDRFKVDCGGEGDFDRFFERR